VAIRCLLIEDDAEISQLLYDYLTRFGMKVAVAPTAAEMRRQLAQGPFDVILLDLMLPDGHGLDLCRDIRRSRHTPIIMLTAQGDPVSRVVGLELGADDYVPKPFEPRELVARIHAVLRRMSTAAEVVESTVPEWGATHMRLHGWVLDRLQRRLTSDNGLLVQLSGAEFRLLDVLIQHAETVLSRERLIALVQTPGVEVQGRNIDLTISRLRQKLNQGGHAQDLIRTVRGEGYVLATRAVPA
jgi:two-component system, OmpR family, response regulator